MVRSVTLLIAMGVLAASCSSAAEPSATTTADSTPVTTTSVAETTTTVSRPPSSTTSTEATSSPANEAEFEAIATAYEVVFSSTTSFEEKNPLVVDLSGLEETVAKYQETGESMGGVSLVAKEIAIVGDRADVVYDFLFGGTPAYPDLTGDAVLDDGTWKITREMFCSIMASARVGCPSE